MKRQKCPICGEGILTRAVGPETFTYKGASLTIPDYVTYECAVCGEAIVDNDCMKKSGRLLKDFQRSVDGLLSGAQIKAIRKKLGLTQEGLAEIVGGGKKALARYETGAVCQSRAMDNLLRILDAYPYALRLISSKYRVSMRREGTVVYPAVWQQETSFYKQESDSVVDAQEAAYGA